MENIVEIKYGDYIARINLSRGANCISLRNIKHNIKILREPDYSKELDNPYLYGMPVLFPVNRISNGEFVFEGRKYTFPINEPECCCHLHGVLHNKEFKIISKCESGLLCSFSATNKEPYLDFPHKFEIQIEYNLTNEGFSQKTTVFNNSEYNMPVMLGFHTTFNSSFTGGSKNIAVKAEIKEEIERNMKNYLPTGKIVKFDDVSTKLSNGSFNPFGKAISRHYSSIVGGKMILCDKDKNISVVYENDEKYKFRLIYNGKADEYICLEPQTCLVDCLNTVIALKDTGFCYIEPNKSKEYYSKIYVKEGEI